jgi:pyruvate dehydrogenase E2 component (dihydrolipoyllysine-residue acetyltransferase)
VPTEFTMPKLGLTMEEATIIEWLVADGTDVPEGTAVMRIETDKTETDVEIGVGGVLHLVGQQGEVYPCGAVIAYVLAPGETAPAAAPKAAPAAASAAVSAPASTAAAATAPAAGTTVTQSGPTRATSTGRVVASPNARRLATERGIDLRIVSGTGPGGRIVSEDLDGHVSAHRGVVLAGPDVVASVAARNLADLLGVDVRAVPIDPIEARITRDGVALYVRQLLAAASPGTAPSAPSTPAASPAPEVPDAPLLQAPTRTIRMSGMRGTIAKRMQASLREMAQLTLTMDADMDAVVADRQRRKLAGAAPGFTDYIVAAAARALVEHPDVNSQVTRDGIAVLPDVHVGLAVALDAGLIVPVIRHADRLPIDELSVETTRLAEAARTGKLVPEELEGATFSVSALGMFGVDAFTPVINPPNAAILGVGRLRDDVVINDGQVSTVKRLTLSLTWDHRVLDGAPAASFCAAVVAFLADPGRLDEPTQL